MLFRLGRVTMPSTITATSAKGLGSVLLMSSIQHSKRKAHAVTVVESLDFTSASPIFSLSKSGSYRVKGCDATKRQEDHWSPEITE